jgi:hypothetical protein
MRAFFIPPGRPLFSGIEREGITQGYVDMIGELEEIEIIVDNRRKTLSGTWTLASGRSFAPFNAMHVVLGRMSDLGHETFAGEIVSAVVKRVRGVAFEALSAPSSRANSLEPHNATVSKPADAKRIKRATNKFEDDPEEPADFGDDEPSDDHDAERDNASLERADARRVVQASGAKAIAEKPQAPAWQEAARQAAQQAAEGPSAELPRARDWVEHFAFGPAEVLKSDGERLHLKVAKDGRIREIALAMLQVSRLEDREGKRVYRLDRK